MSIWNSETLTYKVDDIELDVYYEYAHAEPQTYDYCGSPAEISITAITHCGVCILSLIHISEPRDRTRSRMPSSA